MQNKKERYAFSSLLFASYCKLAIRTARNMKIATNTNVRIVIAFSEPRSLVLTKMFIPPPVIAPEAPSDLPP